MPPMGPPPGGHFRGPRDFLTDEEKKRMPKVSLPIIKRIAGYLKPYVWQLGLVFVILTLSAVLGIFPSLITGKIVDLIGASGTVGELLRLLLTAFAVLALSQVLAVSEQYINSYISQKIIYDMKNEMYSHLQKMSHSFFMTEKHGDIVTRMNSDINGVSTVISGTLTNTVSNLLTVFTTLFYLFYTDWRLALVGVIILPLLTVPTRTVSRKRWGFVTQAQSKNDELNEQIEQTLSVSGSLLVKLFSREKTEMKRFDDINKDLTGICIKENRAGSWFHIFMGLTMELGPLLIYFAGGYLVLSHTDSSLTIGDITVMVSLITRLYGPVRTLLNLNVEFVRSLALFERIFDYLDRPLDITEPQIPKKPDMGNPDIVFENVRFSYENGKEILKGINFELPAGKMYALVGVSGAGKSTVINLIPRLYDVSKGSVKISGVDVRDYDIKYLRDNIGIVTQDTYLFNGTVMENLLYAKQDATVEEIYEACKAANIHGFIMGLKDGYDTVVGNRGLKLSGGEKQRVSIARVMLKDPKILILDEATSSLDSISENAIQQALSRLMKGRTSLVIAHRLSTVLEADMIMTVESGVITEMGTHDALMQKGGIYKRLYETQFKKVLEHEQNREITIEKRTDLV